MNKRAPGPWKHMGLHMMKDTDDLEYSYRSIEGDGYEICRVWEHKCEAHGGTNSRLIAAAPELLSALRLALKVLQGKHLGRRRAIWTCSTAISKAEGRDA